MARLTKYGAQQMLLGMFAPSSKVLPSNLYVALTLSVPQIEATGSNISEPSGGGYSRVLCSVGPEHWSLSGMTTIVNSVNLTWASPTTDWGRVVGWALCTDLSGGQVVASGEISSPRFVYATSTVSIPAGSLKVRLEF